MHPATFGEPRRSRWAPTDDQRQVLETSYKDSEFPDLDRRNSLAEQLGIETRQVQVWFQNRRQKARAKANNVVPRRVKSEGSGYRSPDGTDSLVSVAAVPVDHHADEPKRFTFKVYDLSRPMEAQEHRTAAPSPSMATQPILAAVTMPPPPPVPMSSRVTGPPPPMFSPPNSLARANAIAMTNNHMADLSRAASKLSPADTVAFERALSQALQHTQQQMMPPPSPRNSAADFFALERMRMGARLSNLFSPTASFGPRSPIEKPHRIPASLKAGVPMNRRSISMDAIEVLTSGFSA